MELTYATPNIQTEARAQFEARVKAALALTLNLERKLVQWGEAMEQREVMEAVAA